MCPIETKKPEVTLFSWTKDPLQAIALGIDIWHAQDVSGRAIQMEYTDDELKEKFRWLLKQPHQTPFEYLHFVWVIKNCSRAFQQQLTRHRIGFSYSIQSLRVVDPGNFADEGRYTMSSTMKEEIFYHNSMLEIQASYREMIEYGVSTEDARGILPLNIHSPITMACTYRAMIALLRQRMCVAAQEEWKAVATQMRNELMLLDPVLVEPIDCMCKRHSTGSGHCKTLHKMVKADE